MEAIGVTGEDAHRGKWRDRIRCGDRPLSGSGLSRRWKKKGGKSDITNRVVTQKYILYYMLNIINQMCVTLKMTRLQC